MNMESLVQIATIIDQITKHQSHSSNRGIYHHEIRKITLRYIRFICHYELNLN